MTKIFKQLARHWAVCLVVFALLFVQAYCDLSLPDYTSRIVDTGIQQGGIESPLPQTVRQSTLDALSLLMNEEDAQKLQNAYQYYLQDDGVLQLRSDLTEDERTALEDAVTTPDIVLYMAAAQAANTPAGQNSMGMTGLADMQAASSESTTTDSETVTPTAKDLDTVCTQFAAMSQMPGFTREAVQQQLTGAFASLDDTLIENLKSQSMLLVQLEYEAQGVARDVQMGYLFRVGGQMLAQLRLVRHGQLRRVRRRRRPCIGNKIGDRHVGLMPDGGDDRNVGGINRARHALIVERPQIFNRPAAAPRDDEVGDLPFVCVAQRACDLRRRLCSLHAHRQEHDFAHRPARIQNAQHIMHRRARG